MTPIDPNVLLNMAESEIFDFKSGQYQFPGGTDEQKAELLKDIIAFANAWKTGDAFIVIGVTETGGRKDQVVGVTTSLKDNEVQQFVNSKTNRPVKFLIYTESVGSATINVIQIARDQDRPIFLKGGFGKLQANVAYIRSGSTTTIATPDQIRQMVTADQAAVAAQAALDLEWFDEKENERLGREVTLHCLEITKPPPPPPPPMPTPPSIPLPTASTSVLGSMGALEKFFRPQLPEAVIGKLSIHHGPTREELFDYYKERFRYAGLRVWVKNMGARNASSVRVKVTIPRVPGLLVVDSYRLPRKPKNPLSISSLAGHYIYIPVEEVKDGWEASVEVGTLQPQQEFFTQGPFYLTSTAEQTVEATATIFADDLAKPIEIPLKIKFEIETQVLDPKDIKDEDED